MLTAGTDHTCVLGSMSLCQIFRNCQCLGDLRVRIYDLGTLTTWFTHDLPSEFVASSLSAVKEAVIWSFWDNIETFPNCEGDDQTQSKLI